MGLSSTEIAYELTHLPPGENPFLWLSTYMNALYLPHYPKSAIVQLYCNVGLIQVCICFVLAALWLRYKKRHYWWFRRQIGRSLIQPNIPVVGSFIGLVLMILTNVLLFAIVQASQGKAPPHLAFLTLLASAFPGILGEIIIWGIASSYLCHLHSTQSTKQQLEPWIVASNVLGIATPLLHLASFLPLDIIAGQRYAEIVGSFGAIDKILLLEASRWIPGSTFNLANLLPVVPLFTKLENEVRALAPVLRACHTFNASTMVILVGVLALIAGFYLSSVKRLIRAARQGLLGSTRGNELLDQVYQTWAGLVMTVVVIAIVTSVYISLTLYLAIRPFGSTQPFILATFWINSILGFLMSGYALFLTAVLPESDREAPDGGGADARGDTSFAVPRIRAARRSGISEGDQSSPRFFLSATTETATNRFSITPDLRTEMLDVPSLGKMDSGGDDKSVVRQDLMCEVKLGD